MTVIISVDISRPCGDLRRVAGGRYRQWADRKEIKNRWSGWRGAWWLKDGKVHVEIMGVEFVAPFSKFRPHWTRFWQQTIRSEVTVETSKMVTKQTPEMLADWVIEDGFHLEADETGWIVN